MKVILLFFLALLGLERGYSSIASANAVGRSTASLWTGELQFLNQPPDVKSGSIVAFSHPIDADLAEVHRIESKQWADDAKIKFGTSRPKDAKQRKQVNEFIHEGIRALNEAGLKKLRHDHDILKKSLVDHRFIAEQVLSELKAHPTVNLRSAVNYDATGQIGFCFGRAMLAHYRLLKAGVPQSDMAKVFLFGDLVVDRQFWKFHVALILRDRRDGFVVVDPLFEKVLPLSEWIERTSQFEVKGKFSRARFYITDPRKFLPSFGMYHRDQLEDPHLRRYFDDLARHLN
jgi:hypothetical protein